MKYLVLLGLLTMVGCNMPTVEGPHSPLVDTNGVLVPPPTWVTPN